MMSSEQLLPRLLRNMSLRERLDLATMDAELCQEVLAFSDITMASIRIDGVVFGNRWRPLGRGEKSLLTRMTKLERVVVERSLTREELQELFNIKLKKLYLSSMVELDTLPQELTVNQETLKTLYILQGINRPTGCSGALDGRRMKTLLAPSLTRICLTGVRLFSEDLPALFSLPALVSMDLLGSLVNSEGIVQTQNKLKSPPGLEELSLPPSWFSFASNYHPLGYKAHSLRWLTVTKLCLYVHVYDKNLFWYQLDNYMANGMETLVLYGNYGKIKKDLEGDRKTKIEIIFGPNQHQYLSFKGLGDTGLVSHLIKKPPFLVKQNMDYTDWQYRPVEIRKEQEVAAKNKSKKTTHRRRFTGRGRAIRRRDEDLETAREPDGEMKTARESTPPGQRRPRKSSRRSRSTSRPRRATSRRDRPTLGVLTAREVSPEPHNGAGLVETSSSLSVQAGSSISARDAVVQPEELDQGQ